MVIERKYSKTVFNAIYLSGKFLISSFIEQN